MPAGFEWVSLDVQDPAQLEEIYTLLTENYVEDDDNMFRYLDDGDFYRKYFISINEEGHVSCLYEQIRLLQRLFNVGSHSS